MFYVRVLHVKCLCTQILESAYFLREKGIAEESHHQYTQLVQNLEDFIGKTFNDWVSTVEKELFKYLEVPLMSKCQHKHGMIDLSFNKTLLKLFGEMRYWERLRFEVPHYAGGIYKRCEELRMLRENILLIIRDYNRIINSLQPKERALFRERIRSLDKKILPGMTKLTWASDGILFFVIDCRSHAHKIRGMIEGYKFSNRSISANCRKVSEMLLVRLDGKRIYEGNQFEVDQQKHRKNVQHRIKEIHHEILNTMRKTSEVRTAITYGHMSNVSCFSSPSLPPLSFPPSPPPSPSPSQ